MIAPGVSIKETDLTGFIPAVATTGGGFVGQFEWGPVEQYSTVSNKKELELTFGKPNDENYRDWYSAKGFLDYSNNLNIIRVVESSALNATADSLGILVKNLSQYSIVSGTPGGDAALIAAKYPGAKGNGIKVSMADATSWEAWDEDYKNLFNGPPGTSDYAAQLGGSLDELHVVVIDTTGVFSGTPNSVVERFEYVSKGRDAKRLDGEPSFYGTILNNESSYVWFLEVPESADYSPDGAVVSIAVGSNGSGYTSAPTVTITGDGASATAVAVLSATGSVKSLSITDPGTGYSIGEAITITGNGTGATAEVQSIGASGEVTGITVLTGGTGYSTATADLSGIGNGDATATVTIGKAVASITIGNGGTGYTTATITITGDGTGATATTTLSPFGYTGTWNTSVLNKKFKQLLEPYERTLAGGVNGGAVTADELIVGWDMFRNAEVVDVSLLFLGDAGGDSEMATVVKHVIENIAEQRKDCVAFFSPKYSDVVNQNENTATDNVVATRNFINNTSSYAVMDSGWKYMYDQYNDTYRWVPLNPDIAGLCARTDSITDPWYSPAGFSRGQIKNVRILALNPSSTNRDKLYKAGVNSVVSFSGEGILLYGDKTQLAKPSAFQKINVRRLFIVLEKAIATAAKYQLFEFNDEFTRSQFRNMVEPFLRDVKGRRGIYDFKVVCDSRNNTPEVIDRSEFAADIYIKPARSINFIKLNFVAVRTGVEFNEVIGSVSS